MNVDFTCTAMRRPDLFHWTCESLRQNLKDINLHEQTLYLNIDPAPERGSTIEMIQTADRFFRRVIVETPETCNFARAVRWCWMQPQTETFFHLEEDWLLVQPIHFTDLYERLWGGPFCQVALRQYQHEPGYPCVALSHGLWKRDAANVMAKRMRDDWNPEMQLRGRNEHNIHGDKAIDYSATYWPEDSADIVLIDTGTAWRRAHKVTRPNEQQGFNSWEVGK